MGHQWTVSDYVSAFRAVEHRIAERQRELLKAHYAAPDRTSTATELATTVGYETYQGTNLQYGLLAAMLAEEFGVEVQGMHLLLLVEDVTRPSNSPSGQWEYTLRAEVAKALEVLGWV